MKTIIFFITATVLFISLILDTYYNRTVERLSDVEKCPFCYGADFCGSNLSLNKDSFRAVFANFLSTKNVFFAGDFVVKKLGSDRELDEFDKSRCFEDYIPGKKEVLEYLRDGDGSEVRNFRLCNGFEEFLGYMLELKESASELDVFYKNLWTILHVNVEPLILQILKAEDGWPVPKYYGACGRLIFEQNCGSSLNDFEKRTFLDRVHLAAQIIEAAFNFTDSHKHFRFYLTDVSPDNIAVGRDLKVTFVDLENVIVTTKKGSKIHSSELFDDDNYAYSEEDICNSSKSDHNYFTICKLLLSQNAVWPMMKNGLLHSIPDYIQTEHPDIHVIIENCVQPQNGHNRFDIIEGLLRKLKGILHQYNYLD